MTAAAHPLRPRADARGLLASLEANPVIASVKDEQSLSAALAADCEVLFVLYGSVVDIAATVERCTAAGKLVLTNLDFIEGLSSQPAAVEWMATHTAVDGVMSSKPAVVKAARAAGLVAVQRSFLVDSMSYHQLPRVLRQGEPDLVEILPGCVPRVIQWLREDITTPIIAGGLVCDRGDVMAALGAGALAVATSDQQVWAM